MNPTETPASPPCAVLDTNATLDWLVFADAGMVPLSAAILAQEVRWLASPRMRDELARALTYPTLVRWNPDRERALTCFDRWAGLLADPLRTTVGPLVCSDPDDQVFIDLAVAGQARWLVTRDRALLKLKRHAALCGVTVVPPTQWLLGGEGAAAAATPG